MVLKPYALNLNPQGIAAHPPEVRRLPTPGLQGPRIQA